MHAPQTQYEGSYVVNLHTHTHTHHPRYAKPTHIREGESCLLGFPVKRQIPKSHPRPGNLHYQQASQLILMHIEV